MYRTVYVLSEGHLVLDNAAGNLDAILPLLGGPDGVQINLAGCPEVSFRTMSDLVQALERAGYSRVGYIQADPSIPGRCANNSSKPTPLRGAA
jgi:hypothetical protein